MTDPDRRRHQRYAIELPAQLRMGRTERDVRTADVSFRGLFLYTESPPRLRQLVHVSLELPPRGRLFSSHAMCVFRIEAGNAEQRASGVGVQLFATGEQERASWHEFVRYLREQTLTEEAVEVSGCQDAGTPHEEVASPPAEASNELVLDTEVREVRPASIEDLLTLLERELAKGELVLPGDGLAPGDAVWAQLVHPETGGTFDLECRVRRTLLAPRDAARIVVEWVDASEERRSAFQRFAYLGYSDAELDDVVQVSLQR